MSILASIDQRDRKLLLICALLLSVLVALLALVSPSEEQEDPTPSSYSTAPHGAKAAYQLLQRSGYQVERQNENLADVAGHVDANTTVVIADPFLQNITAAREPVKALLAHGARVLITGYAGGLLAPDNAVEGRRAGAESECDAVANGFGLLAGSGAVRMAPEARWKQSNPSHRVAYTCRGDAVAVTYSAGRGTVVWWASSSPLENATIRQADNLVLFLNSIGPAATTRVVWDESLHGDPAPLFSYTGGTPLKWIGWQLLLLAALLLWSYSRRSGPLRPDPTLARTTQIEFVHSLGSLYQTGHAAQAAVSSAYVHFRQRLEKSLAIPQTLSAKESAVSTALSRSPGVNAEHLQKAMIGCETAVLNDKLSTPTALLRVQALYDASDSLLRTMPLNPALQGTHRGRKLTRK